MQQSSNIRLKAKIKIFAEFLSRTDLKDGKLKVNEGKFYSFVF